MTILLIAYLLLTVKVIDIIVNHTPVQVNSVNGVLVLFWMPVTTVLLCMAVIYIIKNNDKPIDVTFITFIGIIVLAWLISKRKSRDS